MDYGLPMNTFFIEIKNFWLEQINWADKFWGIFGIFGRIISTHFGTVSPMSTVSIIQPLFLQKLNLYKQIPNVYLEFGFGFEFEFEPKKLEI